MTQKYARASGRGHLEQMTDFREAGLRGLFEHAVCACEFRSSFAKIGHRVREKVHDRMFSRSYSSSVVMMALSTR